MIAVVQRVSQASVTISGHRKAKIKSGLLILLGIEDEDNEADINWLVPKLINLRIFGDHDAKMNLSIRDVEGEMLVISQFTLHASTKKGNRPSFTKAARPEIAIPVYESFIQVIKDHKVPVQTGEFGADMQVELLNDGPVTLIIDTKNKS